MECTTLTFGGVAHHLEPSTVLEELRGSITEAARSGGGFVELAIVGENSVSILVTPGVPLSLTTTQVQALEIVPPPSAAARDWEIEFYGL